MPEINSKEKLTEEQVIVQTLGMEILYKPTAPFGGCEHPDSAAINPKVAFTSYREHEHDDPFPPPVVTINVDKKEIGELPGKKLNLLPGSIGDRYSFKNMTKEMYENFVKQGKKFITCTGQEFDSLDKAGIDLDGDIITVDGQKYVVDASVWRS